MDDLVFPLKIIMQEDNLVDKIDDFLHDEIFSKEGYMDSLDDDEELVNSWFKKNSLNITAHKFHYLILEYGESYMIFHNEEDYLFMMLKFS